MGSTWLCAGEPVRVVALTDDRGRVWVETTDAHPGDRRYFPALLGALGSGAVTDVDRYRLYRLLTYLR